MQWDLLQECGETGGDPGPSKARYSTKKLWPNRLGDGKGASQGVGGPSLWKHLRRVWMGGSYGHPLTPGLG